MAPQDKTPAQDSQSIINFESDTESDSGYDSGAGTSNNSPSVEQAVDHPMAEPVVDASAADTAATKATESGAVKRSVEDPNNAAGPATKRQKSSSGGGSGSGSGAFPTVKAKVEEQRRRKKLIITEVDAQYNAWKQANESLSNKKKTEHKKEIMKSVSNMFMARGEHPDQIVIEKSQAKPKGPSTPSKSKAASAAPAPRATSSAAEGRAAKPTPSTPQVEAAAHPEQDDISAQNGQAAKTQVSIKSGTKGAEQQQPQSATPKDRKKQPTGKKPDNSHKNAPDKNNGKNLIDGTADYVSNNLVEKAQSDALDTIVKANEKADEIRKEAEEQVAQILVDARAQVSEKVNAAGEEASQIIKDSEAQVSDILAEARQRAEENLNKSKEEAESIERDSQLRVGEVVAGARDRAVRSDEEAANALRDIDTATEEIRRGKTTLKEFFDGIATRVAPQHEHQTMGIKPHREEETARQVLGALFDSPTVSKLLDTPGMMEEAQWDNVKRCLEKNPSARHDFALLTKMMNEDHPLYHRGSVDFPHHPAYSAVYPPARAASLPHYENYENKVVKKEESGN